MSKVRDLKKRIKQVETLLANLKVDLEKAYGETYMKCNDCGKKSKIRNSYIIRYECWDDNTGSPCGGFYKFGGYFFGCPKCYHYWSNEIEEELSYKIHGSFIKEITVLGYGYDKQQFELEEE